MVKIIRFFISHIFEKGNQYAYMITNLVFQIVNTHWSNIIHSTILDVLNRNKIELLEYGFY